MCNYGTEVRGHIPYCFSSADRPAGQLEKHVAFQGLIDSGVSQSKVRGGIWQALSRIVAPTLFLAKTMTKKMKMSINFTEAFLNVTVWIKIPGKLTFLNSTFLLDGANQTLDPNLAKPMKIKKS